MQDEYANGLMVKQVEDDDTSSHQTHSHGIWLDSFSLRTGELAGDGERMAIGHSKRHNSRALVKKVPKHQPFALAAARREIDALTAIQEPCVPQLLDQYECNSTLYYAVESRPGLSLKAGVGANGPLPEDAMKSIVLQLFAGVAAIFMAGFAHLRITSETLSIDDNGQLTINDFQYAVPYTDEKDGMLYASISEKYGDDIFTAPEVFSSVRYNARKAVMWSCGVVMYHMATAETDKLAHIHGASNDAEAFQPTSSRRKLSTASLPVIPYTQNRFAVPNWARDIISKMLRANPLQRAELIEVATKVPKEVMVKQARPLMELAWLDYKTHVGPLAGLLQAGDDTSSSIFSFSRFSTFSKDSLGPLLPGRRRSSTPRTSNNSESSSASRRRHTIFS